MTVIIGDKPLSDWGYVTYYDLGVPEIDEKKQDIPGRNGSLDYTEALTGFPTYKNRPITIKMSITKRNPIEFREVMSEIRNFCHGQKKKISAIHRGGSPVCRRRLLCIAFLFPTHGNACAEQSPCKRFPFPCRAGRGGRAGRRYRDFHRRFQTGGFGGF